MSAHDFATLVDIEFMRAHGKHPKPYNSAHEAFAVLLEEVEEFKAEVFHGTDPAALLAELVQVAAVAFRIAEDLKLCEPSS